MASRFANNDAQRSIKRMNGDLNITTDQKNRIVNIATAHLAAGNVGDFTTALTAISRADTLNDVTDKLEAMEARQMEMIENMKKPTTEAPTEVFSDELTKLREENARLTALINK